MGIDSREMKEYLKRLNRHKRIVAAARLAGLVAGWVLVYTILGAVVFAIANVGWMLLTGHAVADFWQGLGLMLLLFCGMALTELLRTRDKGLEGERRERAARRKRD